MYKIIEKRDKIKCNFDFDFDFDSNDFDSNDFDSKTNKKKKSKLKQNVIGKHKNKAIIFLLKNDIRKSIFNKSYLKILTNILLDFQLPQKNEQIRIRTQKQLNLISIILKIIDVHKIIDEITISTYTFNRISLETIMSLVKSNNIKKVNLLVSSSYSFRDKKYYQELKIFALKMSKKYNFHLSFAWSHCKITLVKCKNNYYQFEGSMNYSTNNMVENLLIENNKLTYDYDYKFLNQLIFDKKNKALEVIC